MAFINDSKKFQIHLSIFEIFQFHHLALPSARCGRGGSTVSMADDGTTFGFADEKALIK